MNAPLGRPKGRSPSLGEDVPQGQEGSPLNAFFPDNPRQRFLLAGGALVALAALVILAAHWAGWYPPPGAVKSTKPTTALMFVLLGAALALQGMPVFAHDTVLQRVLGGGTLAFAAFALGGKLGFYAVLAAPGPHTLALLITASLGLLLRTERIKGNPGEWLGVAVMLHAGLVLLSHLFFFEGEYSLIFGDLGTTVPTALLALITGALLIAAHPDGFLVGLICDKSMAGALLRRMLPILFVTVLVLGWLRYTGEYAGWYGDHEGIVYMVASATVVALVTALYGGHVVRRMDREAKRQAHLLERVVEDTADAVFIKDREGRYLLANRVALQNIGLTREEVIGKCDEDIMPAEDAAALRVTDLRVIEQGESLSVEEHLNLPGGERSFRSTKSPLRAGTGETAGMICIAHDITEHKRHRAELEFHTTHDALTGLANRNLLRDRLSRALVSAERHRQLVALLVLDLDNFKRVNEEMSYEAGDHLLRVLSARLGEVVRRGDTIARVYGDEFVIVLTEVESRAYVEEVVRRILLAVNQPAAHESTEVILGASIGVSVYPDDASTPEDMERHAEMAMHQAKERGKNCYQIFEMKASAQSIRRLDRERELRRALDEGQLVLYCQPKVELESGQIAGAEGLLRWQHPVRGLIGPTDFIPLAEENGLIVPISEWVFAEARTLATRWRAAGLETGPLAVNLSGRQLQDAALAERLASIIADAGPGAIELEVTETTVLRDHEETARILHRIHEMGIKLALDDFGTGYSSLSFLRKFPVSCLKIDRSFVRDIHTDPGDAAIARTVIAMAHALKLDAVAEGVETVAQLRYLHHHGCDQIQGWLFSKAVPAAEFETMVAEGARLDLEALGISRQRRLLLVDDDAGVLQSLKRVFRREGYGILTANSGEEALAVLGQHNVQVVVSDQRMGGMSGAEMLARVAEIYPETIRIMLTGYTELQSVIDAVNRGAIYKFLTKPWDDRALREHVRDAFVQYEAKFGR